MLVKFETSWCGKLPLSIRFASEKFHGRKLVCFKQNKAKSIKKYFFYNLFFKFKNQRYAL
jgi:hypothetical protein